MGRLAPVFDDNSADRLPGAIQRQGRAQLLERGQGVDEHAHLPAVLARELAREAPTHADVAEIVDHRAEDIAGDRGGSGYGGGGRGAGRVGGHGGLMGGFERRARFTRWTTPRLL